jgi:hypothetical protein
MLLAVPALVLVVALVGLQIWKSGWQSEVDRQLAELRAAGVPTTPADLEAAYRLPEGTEDCTQRWLDATAPLVEAADELKASGLPFLDNRAPELPPPGQDWPQLAEAEALLARFQPSIDQMHEAARRGGAARYPADFAAGFLVPATWVDPVRQGCDVLLLETMVHVKRRNLEAALRSYHAVRALAGTSDGRFGLLGVLVRNAVMDKRNRALGQLIAEFPLDDAQLADLIRDCASVDHANELAAALRTERVLVLSVWGRPEDVFEKHPERARVLQFATGPYDRAFFLDVCQQLEDAATLSEPERKQTYDRIHELLDQELSSERKIGRATSLMILPANCAACMATTRAAADRAAAICGLAAERYRLRHGAWPLALDDLTPDLLPDSWAAGLPVDPFDGQPLRYLVDDDGLHVWSVGMNGRDDGGSDDPRDGDIVFHIPRPQER